MLSTLIAENGLWLPHDKKEVLWGTIAFLIVMGLLVKFAGQTIKDALAKRSADIEKELADAAEARREAEAARDQVKADLADSANKAASIVDEARSAAGGVTADIVNRANTAAAAVRERTTAELATADRQALSDVEGEFSRLAYGAAERVVTANLDDAAQQRLIDDYIARVASN